MRVMRKVIVCVLILVILCCMQSVWAADNNPAAPGTQPGIIIRSKEQVGMYPAGQYPVDYIPQEGVDHQHPDPYLVTNLNRKLLTAKMEQLGYPQDKVTDQLAALPQPWPRLGLPSKGDVKVLVLLIDFSDAQHSPSQTVSDINSKLFGTGVVDPGLYPDVSLSEFYKRSSYNDLVISGNILGWYRAAHPRTWYVTNGGYEALIMETLNYYNTTGHDFAQYDNDNNGKIDNIMVKWAGDHGDWGTFWWAWSCYWQNNPSYTIDGKNIGKYIWSWYSDPAGGLYHSQVDVHEMGHNLGLPDYYDYESQRTEVSPGVFKNKYELGTDNGPRWGVGGFDMMDGNWPDHNTFSKYLLDWTNPIVIGTNPHDTSGGLYPTGDQESQTSVLIMPGAVLNSYSEFFITENRNAGYGNDPNWWTKDGLTIWHVDATLNAAGDNFLYDNSYTDHNLIRLEEADGLEDIQQGRGWNEKDIYGLDQFFGPTTTPNSNNFAGSDTQVHVQNIEPSSFLDTVWARWMIGEYPPTVTSMSPNTGTQNTLLSVYDLEGSNFWSHPKPKVYFWYRLKVGTFYIWLQDYATNVTVVSRNKITCTFDLKGVPTGPYTIYVENPDGETGSLSNGLTVTSPWIRVTVPNGGEKWASGTSHTVTWTQAGLDDTNVRIDLWKEWPVGKYQRSVAASVPANDGSYVWSIPTDVAPSTDYWVNISSISYPTVNDYTDGWLEISAVPQPLVSVKKYISANNASWNDTSIDVSQGAKVYYNVAVKNTGNCVLSSVSFADGSSFATYSMLQPGASWILYYSATAGASDYTNTATVGASSPWGNAPTATDSATYHIIKPAVMIQPTLTEIGQKSTKTVNIVMDKAPTGLSGYKLTITPTNPQITEVLSVTFPAWAGKHSNSTLPGDTFWMRAVDDSDLVKSGARSILLGSLTVRGDQCGTTVFNIGADQFDDDSGNPISPSTVSGTIRIVPIVAPLPGYTSFPTDPDSDGIYEDLNGNGRLDFADVVLYFNQMEWIALYEPVCAFDLNGNGRIDFADIVKLFGEI